jgi:hypothetical protein
MNTTPQVMSMEDFFGDTPDLEVADVNLEDNKKNELNLDKKIDEDIKDEIIPEIKKDVIETFESTPHDILIEDLLKDGDWDDILLEDDNGEQIQLSKMKGIDRNRYRDIKAIQDQIKKESLSEKYVSIDGLDDTTKKLIQVKKEGGDIRPFLQYEVETLHPLQGLDLSNEYDQERLVYNKYLNQLGDSDAAIAQVEHLKKTFKLDIVANQIAESVDKIYKEEVEKELESIKLQKAKDLELEKDTKKQLIAQYKEMGVNEKVAKNLSETISNKDGWSEADRLFFEAKKDPKLFSEIIYLLKDKKGYEEIKGVKIANNINLKTFKLVSSTKKIASENVPQEEDKNKWDDLQIIPIK